MMHRLALSVGVFFMVSICFGEPPAQSGVLRGRFELAGEIVEPADLVISVDPPNTSQADIAASGYAILGLKDESLIVGPNRGIQNVLIWIRDKKLSVPAQSSDLISTEPAALVFNGGRFENHVIAWRATDHRLKLRNDDRCAIDLTWKSQARTPFHVNLLAGQTSVQTVPQADTPTIVRSETLPWISPAVLFPCEHPYFAVSDKEGRFEMRNLPAGQWEFSVWHQRCGWVKSNPFPNGHFRQAIHAGEVDLGTIKLDVSTFKQVPAKPKRVVNSESVRSPQGDDIVPTRDERIAANNRDEVTEFIGKWRLKLPAGFEYDVTLNRTDDGMIRIDCKKAITLLGKFALTRDRQMFLVESDLQGIQDFIWEFNNRGEFVLIEESHRVGSRYVGAILRRIAQ